jgi:hypothetical protein
MNGDLLTADEVARILRVPKSWANATPKAPRTGPRDQMENLLLGLPFQKANWSYQELGEELGSHQDRSTMLS